MQAKDLRSINRWKRLDSFKELLQAAAFGDLVTSVETEVIGEHMLSKPYLVQVELSLLTCKMHYVYLLTESSECFASHRCFSKGKKYNKSLI